MGYVGTEILLKDVLEEHFETLGVLWADRCASLRSPELTCRDLIDRDERIAAHSDGLVLAGSEGIAIARPGLEDDDGSISLAAGYVLLALEQEPAARLVLDALHAATPNGRDGLRLALCYGSIALLEEDLRQAVHEGPDSVAAVAGEALAFHGRLAELPPRVAAFVQSPDPSIRRASWRIVTALAKSGPPRWGQGDLAGAFEPALSDVDPALRAVALEAAAWSRQPWLLDHCRRAAHAPSPAMAEAIRFLGILGTPPDLELVRAVGRATSLGPYRFDALAAFGHPAVLDIIVEAFDLADPRDTAAAAAAFKRMTGVDVGSGRRVSVSPSGVAVADDFEQEFLDEVELPDPALAQAAMTRFKDRFAGGTRLSRCIDLGPNVAPSVLDQLDLQSRWEGAVRLGWNGTFPGVPSDLDRFPKRLRA